MNPLRLFGEDTQISSVAAGDGFVAAVDKSGKDVYIWGLFEAIDRFTPFKYPTKSDAIHHAIHQTGGRVKKVRACGGAIALLTDNGKVVVFGNSDFGQLGVN